MANAKSNKAKKAPAKKAGKKTAKKAAKKAVVKYTASDVVLNKSQANSLEMVRKNEEKIAKSFESMISTAVDSGDRLNLLKDSIQAKYGRVWKVWAGENLPEMLGFAYEQATVYMKVASGQAQLIGLNPTSVDEAVRMIADASLTDDQRKAKAEKSEASAKAKADAGGGIVTDGTISDRTMADIEQCTDREMLHGLLALIQQRLDELAAQPVAEVDPGDDGSDEVDPSDEQDAIAELTG